jgi:predicted house-cleaning NTP pyrophosphatase (Maf/HAM1 superfamily)
MNKNIVLASTSKYRQASLRTTGLEFRCVKPAIGDKEEREISDVFLQNHPLNLENAAALVALLALEKAKSAAKLDNQANTYYIAGDVSIFHKNKFWEKYKSIKEAQEGAYEFFNNKHHVITGVAIVDENLEIIQNYTDLITIKPAGASKLEAKKWVENHGENVKTFCGWTADNIAIKYLNLKQTQIAIVKGLPVEKIAKFLMA